MDVWEGACMPHGTSLVLQGEKIERIVPPGGVVPEGKTIELDGRWVIPALMNTHGHLQMVHPGLCLGVRDLVRVHRNRDEQIRWGLEQCLVHGIGTMQDSASHSLVANQDLTRRIHDGTLAGPRIQQAVLVSPRGGAFAPRRNLKNRMAQKLGGFQGEDYDSPLSGILVYRTGAPGREVRDAVDRAIDERGAQIIKLYDQEERSFSYTPGATVMTQEQIDAAVDQARRRGVPSAMHHVTVESFRRGVRAGVDALVHVPMDGMLHEQDIRAMLEAHTRWIPTLTLAWFYSWDLEGQPCHGHPRAVALHAQRRQRAMTLAKAHWVPGLRKAARRCLERTAEGRMRMVGMDVGHVFRYWSPYVTTGMDNVRSGCLAGAMGQVGWGTDHGASWCGPSTIDIEMAMFRLCLEDDVHPVDLLRMATIQNAAAIGMDDTHGSIEEGKTADLAILAEDPTSGSEVLGRPVEALFLDGRLVHDACGLA